MIHIRVSSRQKNKTGEGGIESKIFFHESLSPQPISLHTWHFNDNTTVINSYLQSIHTHASSFLVLMLSFSIFLLLLLALIVFRVPFCSYCWNKMTIFLKSLLPAILRHCSRKFHNHIVLTNVNFFFQQVQPNRESESKAEIFCCSSCCLFRDLPRCRKFTHDAQSARGQIPMTYHIRWRKHDTQTMNSIAFTIFQRDTKSAFWQPFSTLLIGLTHTSWVNLFRLLASSHAFVSFVPSITGETKTTTIKCLSYSHFNRPGKTRRLARISAVFLIYNPIKTTWPQLLEHV